MMRVRGRIIFTFAGLILLGLVIVLYLNRPVPERTKYIFDNTSGPAIDQIAESKKQVATIRAQKLKVQDSDNTGISKGGPSEKESLIKDLFSKMIVGSGTTLHYFTWLGHEYRHAASREDHLARVKECIFSQFPPEEAAQLFATYRKYLDCEIGVADLTKSFGPVTSTADGLALLNRIQEYRRNFLGRELADTLYGEQVKETEYTIRRNAIINDSDLYAEKKQEQLDRLKEDMWGESADPETAFQKANAYTRYQDALAINQKDLDEIDGEADRQAAIDDIRRQYLPADAVERIKAAERQEAEEQQQEQAYYAAEKRISGDTSLSEEERADQINHLRSEMLGDQAEAMKRRETIEKDREARLKQAGLTPEASP